MEITDEAKQCWHEKRIRSMLLSIVLVFGLLYGRPYEQADSLRSIAWAGAFSELINAALLLIAIIPIFARVSGFLRDILRVKMISIGLVATFILVTIARFIIVISYYKTLTFKAVLTFLRVIFIDNFLLIMSYKYTVLGSDSPLDNLR